MSLRSPSLWRREGLLVSVKPQHSWWRSHAQLPTVLPLSNRLWRIYFGARDHDNRTHLVAVDVDPGDKMKILAEYFDPMLALGPPGTFDHRGVCPSAALAVDGRIRLYYIGVCVREDVRGQAAIGLAVSDDGLNFRKAFSGPVHGTGPFDPYFSTAPTVFRTAEGYRMYYVGGTGWREINGRLDPFYEIRMTRSSDGLIFDPRSETVVALKGSLEAGLGRPWVLELDDSRRLWFSRRGEAYRGPGGSPYRLVSIAADECGGFSAPAEPVVFENPPEPSDFDGWMQAYACVAPHGEDLVMFYNGNDFGSGGFGWALLPGGAIPRPACL